MIGLEDQISQRLPTIFPMLWFLFLSYYCSDPVLYESLFFEGWKYLIELKCYFEVPVIGVAEIIW